MMLGTYTKREEFTSNNIRIGFCGSETYVQDKFNLWIAELYRNKNNGSYSVLLTAEDDEEWVVLEFENTNK